ncbi:MAG TPA: hypothetical protein VJT72_24495 [Pseudonocardiaceae bacterium]|nr:hypothetical protein [Pseudonocardiaceae bacterium]
MQTIYTFSLRRPELITVASRLRMQYAAASPFPYVVIDDFLRSDVLEPVLTEFPDGEMKG